MADDNKNDELGARVQYLKDNQGISLRQIAEEMGISRDKVTALYNGSWHERVPREFILDPYHELIAEWFREIPSLKAIQIWKRLVERKVKVSRRTVEEYTKSFRRKNKLKTESINLLISLYIFDSVLILLLAILPYYFHTKVSLGH